MSTQVGEVRDSNFESEVVNCSLPVLVDFWGPWCGPCKALVPIMEELAGQYAGKVKVVKVNVEVSIETAAKYSIRGLPTVLLFKDGQIKEQITGTCSKAVLCTIVEKHRR